MEETIEDEIQFDKWNIRKKEINSNTKIFFPKHKEIWYISIGKNIGFESYGKGDDFKRPVLVLKKIGTMFLVVSMTTKGKDNKFYYKIYKENFKFESFVTLSQFKTVDNKRFFRKIGKINNEDFKEIKKRIKHLF